VGTPYVKPALTFEQQLARLEERGVIVDDPARAVETLSRVSYYRLSAYFFPLRSGPDSFRPGTRFSTAVELYEFDRRLRLLVLDAIERAEVLARTRITYEMAHACHPFAYAEAGNFDTRFNHDEWYGDLLGEVRRSREDFIEHFKSKYDGFPRVPIWMASEVMSFGTVSRMFEGMVRDHQAAVARAFDVHWRVAQSWLHSLSYVRNVCAHHGRLWNRELAISPLMPSGRPEWSVVNNRRVYGTLCILRHLTKSSMGGSEWAASARVLLHEMDGEERWLKAMGAPVGWATHSFWS
jgi:abortive infection bacteriophage resistance protein